MRQRKALPPENICNGLNRSKRPPKEQEEYTARKEQDWPTTDIVVEKKEQGEEVRLGLRLPPSDRRSGTKTMETTSAWHSAPFSLQYQPSQYAHIVDVANDRRNFTLYHVRDPLVNIPSCPRVIRDDPRSCPSPRTAAPASSRQDGCRHYQHLSLIHI